LREKAKQQNPVMIPVCNVELTDAVPAKKKKNMTRGSGGRN
jgi:hypothetical protein